MFFVSYTSFTFSKVKIGIDLLFFGLRHCLISAASDDCIVSGVVQKNFKIICFPISARFVRMSMGDRKDFSMKYLLSIEIYLTSNVNCVVFVDLYLLYNFMLL